MLKLKKKKKKILGASLYLDPQQTSMGGDPRSIQVAWKYAQQFV